MSEEIKSISVVHEVLIALGQALKSAEYCGELLNGMDAVTPHDEAQVFELPYAQEVYDKYAEKYGLKPLEELIKELEFSDQ